jgi:hypothetical protein
MRLASLGLRWTIAKIQAQPKRGVSRDASPIVDRNHTLRLICKKIAAPLSNSSKNRYFERLNLVTRSMSWKYFTGSKPGVINLLTSMIAREFPLLQIIQRPDTARYRRMCLKLSWASYFLSGAVVIPIGALLAFSGRAPKSLRRASIAQPEGSEGLPIIDVSGLHGIAVDRGVVARELRLACANTGFYYFTGHGISTGLIDRVFQPSREFFALPMEQKLALSMTQSRRR